VNVEYIIMTVDESRAALKADLRYEMRDYKEIEGVEFIDGRIPGVLESALAARGLPVKSHAFHRGELALWLGTINAWERIAESDADGVIIFEDDAVVAPEFNLFMPAVWKELPEDWDFISLAVPSDQYIDYYYDRIFSVNGGWQLFSNNKLRENQSPHYIGSKKVAKAYQGYALVSTMYSPKGARKALELVKADGFTQPADCWLFEMHYRELLNGYAPMPTVPKVVWFEEQGTIARATGMYSID
jgi:GR25 family glycosyltransferase involved in LPS biosynthesis